jgi:colicin import membrane protein
MSSIIINSFYRALTSINENEGINNLSVKQLTRILVDILYPEDGVLTWEDDKTLKIKFNGKVPVEEETHSVEVTIPVAEPAEPAPAEPAPADPEVKEIKVKEVKPKLSKEEKAVQKAEKEAKAAEAKAAKEAKTAKAAEAKAAKEAKTAKPKAAEPKAAEPKAKATKPKFAGNLEKLNATQDKMWKKVAANENVTLTDDHKQRFIAQMNEMDNTVYNTKKLEAWMTEFFTPKKPEMKTADVAMFPVEYKGKEYFIDDNGNVYEIIPGTDIHKKVGNVGMAHFSGLEMPAE